jgi:hypothetical protein
LANDGSTTWSVTSTGGRLATIDATTGTATLGAVLTGLSDEASIRGLTYFGGFLYAIQNTAAQGRSARTAFTALIP